jgi:RNA polymerase sigma-70 factor (ECF subfamily)
MAPMEDAIATVGTEPAPEPVATATFEDFFHQQHRGLYGALWLLSRDRHEAEELMQDAFLKVLERWDRVRDLDDPVGYLYRTAMNLFRSRRRRVVVALRRAVRPQPPADELAEVEEREAVARALAPLTPRQRAAVVLVDVLELTSEEAADVLGIKASTVRVLAARGRAVLKREMRDE